MTTRSKINKGEEMKSEEYPQDTTNSNPTDLLIKHMEQLINEQDSTPHDLILEQLIEKIETIDYQERAFPQVVALREQLMNPETTAAQAKAIEKSIDEMKVNQKHYIVL